MSKLLPANRIAAISAFLVGLASAVLAIVGTFPTSWQGTVIWVVGLIGAIGTALHYMLGAQKSEQNASNETVARLNLQAAKLYHDATVTPPTQQFANVTSTSATNNVTDVTDVTGSQDEGPTEEELAVPENLNADLWLTNRDPNSQDTTTAEPETTTNEVERSDAIEEPTSVNS